MKETQVLSFEGGEFIARYQCTYFLLSSTASLYIYVTFIASNIRYYITVQLLTRTTQTEA